VIKPCFSLSWDVEELKSLTGEGHSINHELLACIDLCETGMFEQCNVPQKLTTLRKRLLDFNKRTVDFRRTPATHIFVLMLCSDVRDRKPYALIVLSDNRKITITIDINLLIAIR